MPSTDVRRRGCAFPLVDDLFSRLGMEIVGPGMVGWRFALCAVLPTLPLSYLRFHRTDGPGCGLCGARTE
ncbi:hypothetical protein FRAHR75_700014 [Frankia sp. Hr75.2]|nr:hypothetical protein FRAHR75_700014 [Frankia sp. Hr75.2]SQD99571.1 hypothetical protein FMEAI12_5440001 [Parafrankia sp. Ea1.12]